MTAVVLLLSFEAMLADEFQVREHGSHIAAQLVRNRPSRCHPIAVASEHHPSPEVRSRCGRLFGRYREHLAAAEVKALFGVDAVQALLGHHTRTMAEHYGGAAAKTAAEVARNRAAGEAK